MRSTEALPRFPLMDGTVNNLASVFYHCCYSHFFLQLCQNNEDEMLKTVFFFPSLLMMRVGVFFSLCNPQLWDVKRIIARLKKQKDAKQTRHQFFKLSSEFLFSSPGCLRKQEKYYYFQIRFPATDMNKNTSWRRKKKKALLGSLSCRCQWGMKGAWPSCRFTNGSIAFRRQTGVQTDRFLAR